MIFSYKLALLNYKVIMRFFKQAPLLLSITALVLSLMSFFRANQGEKNESLFAKKVLTSVRSCVEFNQAISQKEEIFTILDRVAEESHILESGNDDLRVKYVHSQGCIEHVLACLQALGEIDQLIGVIHTPTPATPLCVKAEGPVDDILDESIRYDLHKLLTVRSRAQIVREYLMKGGKLYVVYPQGGLEKRTPEQQQIYRAELARFEGNLIDWVLATDKIEPDMIGATYLFRNPERQVFAFSIKSRQVNDIQSQAEWGIWFGPVLDKKVAERVNSVFDYLSMVGGPDPRREITL